mmetsp:Transcript_73128/g.136695  ORF Transcript_73128/g.136695 Transcript_73128/m.136695 type:complete len:212 (-) Transcript_73128:31-666(-)
MVDGLNSNFYDILGAHQEASARQIRHAYRQTARHWHPDKAHPADRQLAETRFKQVKDAYDVLGNPETRCLYDMYLTRKPYGYIEVSDPSDPFGPPLQVRFRDWQHFRDMCSSLAQAGGMEIPRHYYEDDKDENEAPLTMWEWIGAGVSIFALWFVLGWYPRRQHWLRTLPAHILQVHVEYSVPVAFLLSPLFFGSVGPRDVAKLIESAGAQ